jgi:hypothetical protein
VCVCVCADACVRMCMCKLACMHIIPTVSQVCNMNLQLCIICFHCMLSLFLGLLVDYLPVMNVTVQKKGLDSVYTSTIIEE